jgi:hypothetical protein
MHADGEPGVHRPEQFRGLPDARRELAVLHGTRHFGAIDLHAADAEQGRMATASTMIPMPPSQLSKWRHKLMDRGRNSSPDSTVPPVVVSPDAASKYASG